MMLHELGAVDAQREKPHSPAQLLLTTQEAARLLSVSPRTLARLTSDGRIQPIRVGRLVRYAVADLEAFIARQRRGIPEPGRN